MKTETIKRKLKTNKEWSGKLDCYQINELSNAGYMCMAIEGGSYLVEEKEDFAIIQFKNWMETGKNFPEGTFIINNKKFVSKKNNFEMFNPKTEHMQTIFKKEIKNIDDDLEGSILKKVTTKEERRQTLIDCGMIQK